MKEEMEAEQREVPIYDISTYDSRSLIESVVVFGGGVTRLSFSLITLGTSLLPRQTRRHMRNSFVEAIQAVKTFPGEVIEVTGKTINRWVSQASAEISSKEREKEEKNHE